METLETAAEVTELGTLCCMNQDGDKRLQWNASNPAEVAEAEKVFADFKGRGYLAYKTDKKGQMGTVIDKFDAKAERIIMQPQMVGG